MNNYKQYINALRACAKEHKDDVTPFAHIRVSDMCNDTASLLEGLEQQEKEEKETGQWIIRYVDHGEIISCECSKCGSNPIDDFIGSYEETWIKKLPSCCPNCGLKMKGSQYKTRTYWRAEVMVDGRTETIYSMEDSESWATHQILYTISRMAKEKYKLIKMEELHNE